MKLCADNASNVAIRNLLIHCHHEQVLGILGTPNVKKSYYYAGLLLVHVRLFTCLKKKFS